MVCSPSSALYGEWGSRVFTLDRPALLFPELMHCSGLAPGLAALSSCPSGRAEERVGVAAGVRPPRAAACVAGRSPWSHRKDTSACQDHAAMDALTRWEHWVS